MAVLDKAIQELCNGCEICVFACPQDVFRIDPDTKKAIIKYLDDCVACGICQLFCPGKCLEVTPERLKQAPSACPEKL